MSQSGEIIAFTTGTTTPTIHLPYGFATIGLSPLRQLKEGVTWNGYACEGITRAIGWSQKTQEPMETLLRAISYPREQESMNHIANYPGSFAYITKLPEQAHRIVSIIREPLIEHMVPSLLTLDYNGWAESRVLTGTTNLQLEDKLFAALTLTGGRVTPFPIRQTIKTPEEFLRLFSAESFRHNGFAAKKLDREKIYQGVDLPSEEFSEDKYKEIWRGNNPPLLSPNHEEKVIKRWITYTPAERARRWWKYGQYLVYLTALVGVLNLGKIVLEKIDFSWLSLPNLPTLNFNERNQAQAVIGTCTANTDVGLYARSTPKVPGEGETSNIIPNATGLVEDGTAKVLGPVENGTVPVDPKDVGVNNENFRVAFVNVEGCKEYQEDPTIYNKK